MKTKIILLALALVTSGCAVGPLVNHETGRTVGDGNDEITGGYGTAGYVIKWSHGYGANFDAGIQLEQMSLGLRLKYAFINNQSQGMSLSGAAGLGTNAGGDHYYADIMTSYFSGKTWEPFFTGRYVHVKTDPLDFQSEDTTFDFTFPSLTFDYGQLMVGTRIWFTQGLFLSLEASKLFAISEGVEFGEEVLVGAGLGTRF